MTEICAELGQTMNGDVGLAVDMVAAFAEAGATSIKVQMLDPDLIATDSAPSYWQTGPPTFQREAFTAAGVIPHAGWFPVRAACAAHGIGFVATPFDLGAVEVLRDLDPAAVKVASGDITFLPLLDAVAGLGKPVILSTGAATVRETQEAVRRLSRVERLVLLACTLAYPTPLEEARLGRIEHLSTYFGREAGYSDHTTETITGLLAVLAGASWLEKHVTMRPSGPECPDNAMGLTPSRFADYARHVRRAELLLGGGDPGEIEMAARAGARRAARYVRDLPAGHDLSLDDFTFLRPDPEGDGRSIACAVLAAEGRFTAFPVRAGEVILDADLCVTVPF